MAIGTICSVGITDRGSRVIPMGDRRIHLRPVRLPGASIGCSAGVVGYDDRPASGIATRRPLAYSATRSLRDMAIPAGLSVGDIENVAR